jgi:CRP/FNR family cyclic AMP-dependent transcriptional regulator
VVAVLDGYVKLSSTTAAGREVVLEIIRPGMSFGELAAINNWPRDSDAVALSRCRVLAIDGRQFTQVMERSPAGLLTMVHSISERLRAATQRVLDTIALPAPARVAKTLLHLAELQSPTPQGLTPRNGVRLALQLSQADLGGMTGLTRESINKQLASLREAGSIALSGGSVTLLDIAALESLLSDHDWQRSGPAKAYGRRSDYVHAMPRPSGPFFIQRAANAH